MYPILEKLKAYGLEETGVNSWRSLCPCHNDKNPSFDIKLEGNKFLCHCFACDANGADACKALDLPEQALFADYTGEAARPFALEAQKVTPQKAQGGKLGLTLAEYAQAKGFNIDNLKKWGLIDSLWTSKKDGFSCKAVIIPYYDENGFITKDNKGKDLSIRYRLTLTGSDRFRWAFNAKPKNYLYGAHGVAAWNDDYICIVEGESDCHAGWSGGLAVVGLPGAGMWNEAKNAGLLARYKTIYVFIEGDTGGNTLYNSLTGADGKHKTTALIEKMRFVSIPADMGKDLSDVWRHFGGNKEEFRNYVFNDLFGSAAVYDGEIVTGAAGSADGRSATSRENGKAGGRPREKRDPSDIAELFYKKGGLYRYYRQVWYMYDGQKYTALNDAEFSNIIIDFLIELRVKDKIENEQMEKEYNETLDRNKGGFKPIKEQEAKKNIASDVIECLKTFRYYGIDSRLELPFRISTKEKLSGLWWHCLNGYVNIEEAAKRMEKITSGQIVNPLDESVFIPNTDDIFSLNMLNLEYNELYVLSLENRFLCDVLKEDDYNAIVLMCGLTLTPDRRHNVAFLLFGPGGEGKGTFLKLLGDIFKGCHATKAINQLGDQFDLIPLSEMTVNIGGELPEDKTGMIKTYISGIFKRMTSGDENNFDIKYENSRNSNFTALSIYTANALYSYMACDNAALSRWNIIEFSKVFRGTDAEKPNFIDEVTSSIEKSAFFNVVMLKGYYNAFLKEYTLNNGVKRIGLSRIPESENGKRRKELLQVNETKYYISEMFIFQEGAILDFDKEYKLYDTYCREQNIYPYGKRRFIQTVEDVIIGTKEVRKNLKSFIYNIIRKNNIQD